MHFPMVVKSMDPRLQKRRAGAGSVAIVNDAASLIDIYDRWEVPDDPNLMIQEFIPGGPETIWMFNGYFGADSECKVSFTGRKIRQHPDGTGATSFGACELNAVLEQDTISFLRKIGYRGIVDLGWRFDARDNRFKLLDVNPRMGATFRLFVSDEDVDVVRAEYLDLTGQAVLEGRTVHGRRWLVEPSDTWTSVELIRQRRMTFRQWFRSLGTVDEFAWFATDDPVPFVVMVCYFLGARLARKVKARVVRPLAAQAARLRWPLGR
ncbi:MAG: hypothetical protein NVS3B21_03280 [Acidimicrobiales bacterium]